MTNGNSGSKFQGLLDAAGKGSKPKAKKATSRKAAPAKAEPKQAERKTAKSKDPDFEQITAYIRKDTHQETKIALLQEGKGQQFSELVETLLAKWLKAQS